MKGSCDSEDQGCIQVCFDSIQPLWAPKKLPKFFSKSKYMIVFSVKMAEEINKEELSLLKHTKSLLKSTKFHCDVLCCR